MDRSNIKTLSQEEAPFSQKSPHSLPSITDKGPTLENKKPEILSSIIGLMSSVLAGLTFRYAGFAKSPFVLTIPFFFASLFSWVVPKVYAANREMEKTLSSSQTKAKDDNTYEASPNVSPFYEEDPFETPINPPTKTGTIRPRAERLRREEGQQRN
eukprot:TRINITY_DN9213_c0_g1_i1.p1 TRINITY_DN9213_c0_g1~~TRINITY_DN9213_c0_g1_i1.p1  ORF type:complete len:173 (+),score=33.49 TRINITY_DN9213_c0_g1_i1:53-520(+)